MKYYSAFKKKGILLHATTWMKLEDITLLNELVTEGHILHDSIYMWYLK